VAGSRPLDYGGCALPREAADAAEDQRLADDYATIWGFGGSDRIGENMGLEQTGNPCRAWGRGDGLKPPSSALGEYFYLDCTGGKGKTYLHVEGGPRRS